MNDRTEISKFEEKLREARQRVTDAEKKDQPVSAEKLLELRERAHSAWVKLENAKKNRPS